MRELLAVSEFEGEISIFTSEGKRVSRFMADSKSVAGIDWHPTQNILTAVGSTIGLFTHLGDTIRVLQPREVEVFLWGVDWNSDGTRIITTSNRGVIALWDKEANRIRLLEY